MTGAWTKFGRAYIERGQAEKSVRDVMAATGENLDFEAVVQDLLGEEIWLNNRYQVHVRRGVQSEGWPEMIHLSIKRIDKAPIHDWRDLQRIKNEIVGAENEAVELYPAESRLVDSANQFHLWVLAETGQRFPFGFTGRLVINDSIGDAVQRRREDG